MQIRAQDLLKLASSFNAYLAFASAMMPVALQIRKWITDALASEDVTEEERRELKVVRADLEKRWAALAPPTEEKPPEPIDNFPDSGV